MKMMLMSRLRVDMSSKKSMMNRMGMRISDIAAGSCCFCRMMKRDSFHNFSGCSDYVQSKIEMQGRLQLGNCCRWDTGRLT